MNARAVDASADDITVRELLSSLTALQVLAMVMSERPSEDEILDLAVSALASIAPHCRVEAIWLEGTWRLSPPRGLDARIGSVSKGGGLVESTSSGWTWAFALASRGGPSGYLIVGSDETPPEHEWSLIQALARETGVALANARLLAGERAIRARLADEQATLRRVAALVARAARPEEVFTAVAAEAGRLLESDFAIMSRYDTDGSATVVGAWNGSGQDALLPVGTRLEHEGRTVHTLVYDTGRPARIDDYRDDTGIAARIARDAGVHSVVAVPIRIGGLLWGVIGVASRREEPLPADAEAWLAGFTELVATAIAHAQARVELRGIAEEQAAMRRVATLVARGASSDDVFAAVAAEVGQLLDADITVLSRYESDGVATVVGCWSSTGAGVPLVVGSRLELGGRNIHTLVFETAHPAKIDDSRDAFGPAVITDRRWARSTVGVPINVECRLWGVVVVASQPDEPLPADTEARLAGFTELVGTALANAEAQAALSASRARIIAAADTARNRIERDLHDGAQQRLVSLALQLRAAQAKVSDSESELALSIEAVAEGLSGVLEELREIGRGIHPATLATGGLPPALRALARRSTVPVRLDVKVDTRLPEQIELAVYYVVAEALTNAAKHAQASVIDVEVHARAGVLHITVRDDGRGGADTSRGSGLVGITDRVETLGGLFSLDSPPGAGTRVAIALPLHSRRPS
jgi:signal transduction histidine kinase